MACPDRAGLVDDLEALSAGEIPYAENGRAAPSVSGSEMRSRNDPDAPVARSFHGLDDGVRARPRPQASCHELSAMAAQRGQPDRRGGLREDLHPHAGIHSAHLLQQDERQRAVVGLQRCSGRESPTTDEHVVESSIPRMRARGFNEANAAELQDPHLPDRDPLEHLVTPALRGGCVERCFLALGARACVCSRSLPARTEQREPTP